MCTVLTVICFAASALLWKVAPCPTRSRGIDSWSQILGQEFFGRESLEMATLGRESLDIPNMSRDVSVAPPPLRSRKSRRIIMVAKVWKCQVLVWKVWTWQNFAKEVWT